MGASGVTRQAWLVAALWFLFLSFAASSYE
jgi:hypothetical protein